MAMAFISLDDSESFLRDPFTSEYLSDWLILLRRDGFKLTVERISPDGWRSPLFSTNDAAGLCLDLQGFSGAATEGAQPYFNSSSARWFLLKISPCRTC